MKTKDDYESFLQLSAVITGYQRVDLLGTGVAWDYFTSFCSIVGKSISDELWQKSSKLLKRHKSNEEKLEKAIRVELLSDNKFGPLVRNLIKLWYLGQWDELPAHYRVTYGTTSKDVSHILSGDSYKEGLVWEAIGAHPMGAKQPGFGTWSSPPKPPDID